MDPSLRSRAEPLGAPGAVRRPPDGVLASLVSTTGG